MAIGPCRPGPAARRAVPARRGVVPQRATVPAVPCRCRARAWPPAQGTARGPSGRAESTPCHRAEHAHAGKRQPREVAAAVGVLDVAAAAPASGEEDEVVAVVAGGVRASQEGAATPAVVGREEDGRAAADAAGGQREMGGEARRWERRDARL